MNNEKLKVMQWLIDNNKFGKEAGFLKEFEEELNKAIKKEEKVITTWMIGNELLKDNNCYMLRWNRGKFEVEKMSKEEAEANEILGHRSYLTFVKEINPVKKTNNIKDTTWFNEIEEIYRTFSLIFDDKYTPGSRREIKNAKIEVEKLKKKYSGNADFDKEIAFLDTVLIKSNKRKFSGSKITLIGVFLGILIIFYMGGKVKMESGNLLIDKAEQIQKDKIVKLEREIKGKEDWLGNKSWSDSIKEEIKDLKKQEQSNQIKERIAVKEKQILEYDTGVKKVKKEMKDSQKEVDFLKSMTAEEYRDYQVKSEKEMADSISGYAWLTFFWFALYVVASFPTVYTINKREAKRKKKKKSSWAWLFVVIAAILNSAHTVRYKRSDGSTYDDNSQFMGAVATAIALPIVAMITVIILLKYIAIFAFLTNIVIPYFDEEISDFKKKLLKK